MIIANLDNGFSMVPETHGDEAYIGYLAVRCQESLWDIKLIKGKLFFTRCDNVQELADELFHKACENVVAEDF